MERIDEILRAAKLGYNDEMNDVIYALSSQDLLELFKLSREIDEFTKLLEEILTNE